ncbi:MAG: cation-transporting P-type ATPase [Chlamydiae bacterium]|nr:cation-transporting P-type ATPase [Chlamydiota bacterium]
MAETDLFHSLSIEETFKRLESSPQGLSSEEVEKRQKQFGKNVLIEEKISKFKILLRQFNSGLIYILFAASLVSALIGEWTDFLVINGIILVNGLIGFWQELKAESSIAALKKMTESKNQAMRDGKFIHIASSELVPGDYVIFHEGEVVTADIRLTDSTGLMIDESPMTGESAPIVKDHTAILPESNLPYELGNTLLAGTIVVRGSGHGVVAKTGAKTYLASIAEKAKEASPETPLNKALSFFTRRYVILLIATFFLLGVVGYLQGRAVVDIGYILLAALVSAVPEGLPIVLTLVMVLGALALTKRQALIRYLPSVETLGSVTIIASDKTGTITEGKLIVKEVYSQEPEKLKMIAALCNDSRDGSGDPLDVALSKWVEGYDGIRAEHPRSWTHSFDTRLMLMATANKINDTEELLIKGAFESLKEKVENKDELKELDGAFTSFLEQGLRVIAFGAGKWENNHDPASWKIKIIGLVGFLDPAKEGVKEAVIAAKKAGVRVVMITGDHPMTAKAVAKEVEIWAENDKIVTGKEIEGFSDEQLLEALKTTTVLARILPEHKYRVVKLLQQSKEIVAVTGDGVNDVPALKAADIGIAMGSGTEAAKSVSKMVITDNNLRIIVEAIRNARVIACNIRKVIYYLISTSLQEVLLIALAILSNLPLPLVAIQILWINLVTDGVLDKTFPFAKEEGDVMTDKPRRPEKQFFDLAQIIRILTFTVVLGLLCFFLYIYLIGAYSVEMVSTIIFTSVVVAQWANGVQAQKESEPFFKNVLRSFTINPLIFLGLALGIVLQCSILYFAPTLFHSVSMDLEHWKYPLLVFFAAFGVVEIRKWIEWCLWRKKVV